MCQHNLPCSIVYAHCLLPGRAFASLYGLLFLEKEAEIGGREVVVVYTKKVKKKKKKKKKKIIFFLLFLGKSDMVLGKKGGYFRLGMGPKFGH